MRVALVVPPVHGPVNEIVHGYMPPLGLLYVGGGLVDAGHEVTLIDADAGHVSARRVIARLRDLSPEAVLVGHSGSIAAHPSALRLLTAVRARLPRARTVYGGVYPSFMCRQILSSVPALDFVVLGEGELTAVELLAALEDGSADVGSVAGLAWRDGKGIRVNGWREPAPDVDRLRAAWELVDWPLYESHHRDGRSAVVQYSRGCPNACSYCGQWRFWRRRRHRSVESFVAELELLRDRYRVTSVWVADENWACEPGPFHDLLRAMAERTSDLDVYTAQCARDVVRDRDEIDLYRRAGIVCLMMGVESMDDRVVARIGKHNPREVTREAVDLLRRHGIASILNVVHGLRPETWRTLWWTARRVRSIAPDFYNALHFTPLPWTREGGRVNPADVVQRDLTRWDFRHPVMRTRRMSVTALAVAVKLTELFVFSRPFWALGRVLDPDLRRRRLFRRLLPRLARAWLAECRDLVGSLLTRARRRDRMRRPTGSFEFPAPRLSWRACPPRASAASSPPRSCRRPRPSTSTSAPSARTSSGCSRRVSTASP